jgi:DNA-binding CsgD family transcriptional regulator
VCSSDLTNRESEVFHILAQGYNLARVQQELFISEGTAITHRRKIYQKLGIHSKAELIDLIAEYDNEECFDKLDEWPE